MRAPGGVEIGHDTRTLTVADIYEALTADRPYRRPMSSQKAIAIMQSEEGTGIDNDCFEALRRVVGSNLIPAAAQAPPFARAS